MISLNTDICLHGESSSYHDAEEKDIENRIIKMTSFCRKMVLRGWHNNNYIVPNCNEPN